MKATASAKAIATIIAIKILGAADGFLPKDVMLAKELAAKTAHGPKMQSAKMMTRAILRSMTLTQLTFKHDRDFVLIHFNRTPHDIEKPSIHINAAIEQTGHHGSMKRQDFKNPEFSGQDDTARLPLKYHLCRIYDHDL